MATAELHENQGGLGRHKCVVCAYEAGYTWGREHSALPAGPVESCSEGSRAPAEVIDGLEESQKPPGRHRCAVCAWQLGFRAGRKA